MEAGRALVIGAGVSGLTSALALLRQGWRVTVVAEHFAPQVTSVVAGALWEFPPAICSRDLAEPLLRRSKCWALTSYQVFKELAANPQTGVFMRPANFFFRRRIEDSPEHFRKMTELRDKVRDFVRDPALAKPDGIDPGFGLRDAYSYTAPMIDTDAYMAWLSDQVKRLECRIESQRISGVLREQESALRMKYEADVIVNCAGLNAGELANDELFPLRGALVRAHNDGRSIPRITQAYCVPQGECADERGFVFIVPRGQDMLVLGGLAEPGQRDLSIGLNNYAPVREMLARCIEFMPALKNIQIDDAEPVRVGLRPMRARDVRLEIEQGTRIIHNYGHGGSGVTLSWGCGQEVAELARTLPLDR
jgi:D-amino-acid oxidase